MREALRVHWPEYLMEAWGLGTFMISAGAFVTLIEYPGSPVPQAIADPDIRRALIGLAMGLTAIGIIYSPWGQRSGAHINPSVTLTFLRLGKVAPWDAAFYIIAQFIGGTLGVLGMALVLDNTFTDPPVAYVATVPGLAGVWVAFVAELLISMGLMLIVLFVSNTERIARFTGLCASCLVALYITVEAPFSGMSMNPARTFASAAAGVLGHTPGSTIPLPCWACWPRWRSISGSGPGLSSNARSWIIPPMCRAFTVATSRLVQVRHEAMDFVLAGDRNARILRWPATSLLLKKASCLAGDVPVAPTRSDASRSVSLRCCTLVGYGPSL